MRTGRSPIVFGLLASLCLAGNSLAAESAGVTSEILARSTTSWDGVTLPAYPAEQPEITILRIRIPPGAELPLHRHPVINAGFMLSGELTVITEKNEKLRLKAGDALIEVMDKWHYGKNEGQQPAEIVVFYAGEVGEPITVYPKAENKQDVSP